MKLLANENIPREAVIALREDKHDVFWVREVEPGADDESIMQRAQREKRILLTFDKDFGELVYHRGAKFSQGLVLLRVRPHSPKWLSGFLCSLFKKEIDWDKHFAAVTENNIRLLPL